MIEFTKYAKIKDRYCLSYFGTSDEYLLQIFLIKPFIENKFNGVKIYIGCRDDKKHLFGKNDYILEKSQIIKERLNFGYIREITFNGKEHPIENLVRECEIDNIEISNQLQEEHTTKCVIITKGNYPTVSLDQNKVNALKRIATQNGFECVLDEDISNAGLVMGVESWNLFKAASEGIKTKLWPTGMGTNLYKFMFPKGELITI